MSSVHDEQQPPQKRICLPNNQVEELKEEIRDPLAGLPREIVTKIFLHLSHRVLFQKCALVSKRWNAFVNSEHFLRSLKQFPSELLTLGQPFSHLLIFHRDVTFTLTSPGKESGELRSCRSVARFLDEITSEDKEAIKVKQCFMKTGFRVFNLSSIIPYYDLALRISDKLCIAICPTSREDVSYEFGLSDEHFQLIERLAVSWSVLDNIWLVSARLPRYLVTTPNRGCKIRFALSSERNELARRSISDSRALSSASREGKIAEMVNILSNNHPEIDGICGYAVCQSTWETPLINAAKNGKTEAVRVLLNAGASLDRSNGFGLTPLLAAASGGHTECVRVLLNDGAEIEISNRPGLTALDLAATNGHADCVDLLITRGARADSSLIGKVIERGHADCVRLLMDHGVHTDPKKGDTAFFNAVRNWNLETVELLIERGANARIKDCYGLNAFHCVIDGCRYRPHASYISKQKDILGILDLLTKQGCDINSISANDQNPLMFACSCGATELVEWLLDHGADANARGAKKGSTSLLSAISSRNHDDRVFMVDLLLDHGARFDLLETSDKESSLAAVFRGADRRLPAYDPELFALLIQRGANVNVHLAPLNTRKECSDEPSLLLRSLSYGMMKEAGMLIRAGADVNMANKRGETPLMIAAKLGDAGLVDLLMKKSAQVDAVDSHGRTVLMYAAGQNDVETVDLLVKNGAQVNGRDNYGRTALMHAARSSSTASPPGNDYDVDDEDEDANEDEGDEDNDEQSEGSSEEYEDEDPYERCERERMKHVCYRSEKGFVPRNFRVVKAMLRHGADATFVDHSGRIALDFVSKNGKDLNTKQVARLLGGLCN